jgi:hypothetical protein
MSDSTAAPAPGPAAVDEHGRVDPPPAAGELETLLAFLDHHRATFAWKTAGVDADGWRRTVGASTMTLGGMTKHLALVEDDWFDHDLMGRDAREPWASNDWDADPDWEWRTGALEDPDRVRALWSASVERARACTAEALADGGLDRLAARPWRDGRYPSLRWILVHMIEEYARHNGHADLIRESIDGVVGE